MIKKIVIITLVLLITFSVGVWLWYQYVNPGLKIEKSPSGGILTVEESSFIKVPKPENDADVDGVLDDVEKKYGTSNGNIDSDHDGLTDKIEIEKLGTDPTKFDTDGDGFADGVEIIRGYNPLGSGKLTK